ncbi:MAG: hypothetical protein LUQ47_05720 [Methanotrichaceae archaeon]|nr:hypothetical protein [Methanotrichaceae archaeon]
METVGDLLEKVRELGSQEITEERAKELFGWNIKDISAKKLEENGSFVIIAFDNKLILFSRYFLNLDPLESEDNCEVTLALRTGLRSRVKYNIYYSGYIHGQGYIRLRLGDIENRMIEKLLEDFYVPALKAIYKPIIEQFKGFHSKDYFGAEADNSHGEIYYSSVRFRSEYKEAKIWDVISKLHELDALLAQPDIRRALAELDLKLSLLPGVMWL